MTKFKVPRRSFLLFGGAFLTQIWRLDLPVRPTTPSQPSVTPTIIPTVRAYRSQINGIPFYQTIIDLKDPNIFVTIGLANDANFANTISRTNGDENFDQLVARSAAAVVVNGTFASTNPQKTVTGNLVAGGRFLKYSPWENFGTTLGLGVGNRPEMITARVDGRPVWNKHWFSITSGPRLLRNGEVSLNPRLEGFKDPDVLGTSLRTAIGFSQDGKKLFLASFDEKLYLDEEAEAMKAIGCYEAMNLDGGPSRALASDNVILVPPARKLTNVILVYDGKNPPPEELKLSWEKFQTRRRPAR